MIQSAFTKQSYLNGSTQSLGTLRCPLPKVSNTYALCAPCGLTFGVALKGYKDACVSRQCFTLRLTVGIAKGMPMLGNGHKKTDGKVGGSIMGLPRWALSPVW